MGIVPRNGVDKMGIKTSRQNRNRRDRKLPKLLFCYGRVEWAPIFRLITHTIDKI